MLVDDLTEARRRERELGVKEATIREVHHRVKNNLQTIASLLRMQARRSSSDEVRRGLSEAVERAAAMATVHDMLAHSAEECVDFAEVARRVVGLGAQQRGRRRPALRRPRLRRHRAHRRRPGDVARAGAHGAGPQLPGARLRARRTGARSPWTSRATPKASWSSSATTAGACPPDFDPATTKGLGLSIVRTLVEEDLGGTLSLTGGEGAGIAIRVPLGADGEST